MTGGRWAAALVALLLGVTVVGCEKRRPTVRETSPWTSIARTLKPGLDPSSPNTCNRGDDGCLPAVLAGMRRRFERLARDCEHHAVFALMYLRVTEAVGRENGGSQSGDPRYLRHLDAVFAQLYFDAFDAWTVGRRGVPRAWQIAFEAADRRRVSGMGNLLLGMNAHISRDLPFAVASIGVAAGAQGTRERRSFENVNDILSDVQGPILREAARRFDETIADTGLPGISGGERDVAGLLASWRDEAMRNGERLLAAATAAQRAEVAGSIEDAAAGRATVIVAATSRIPFSDAGKAREKRCAAARGADAPG